MSSRSGYFRTERKALNLVSADLVDLLVFLDFLFSIKDWSCSSVVSTNVSFIAKSFEFPSDCAMSSAVLFTFSVL